MGKFSTTTATEQTAWAVALMATMQSYFIFYCGVCCRVPSVELLGTADDYRLLSQRINRLLEYDNEKKQITKWVEMLQLVCGHLIATAEGKPDPGFWACMISNRGGGSGPPSLSGWVTAFCCFTKEGKWQPSPEDDSSGWRQSWVRCSELNYSFPVIDVTAVPQGLLTVPMIVTENEIEYQTQVMAGSISCNVISSDKSRSVLQPRVDWCLGLRDEDAIAKATERSGCSPNRE